MSAAVATARAAVDAPEGMRERILDAADRLFYAHGIQSIGVDAVVLEAGISKRTLYRHFGSREQLVAAYLARRGARQPELPRLGEELHEILGVFKRFERWFAADGFRGCPFSNAIAELGGDERHPALAVARDVKHRNTAWFELRLRALGAAHPAALAMQLSILVEGAVALAVQRKADGGAPQVANVVHVARAAGAAARALLANAGVAAASHG
jgi:AcrR family transcriptional regulator